MIESADNYLSGSTLLFIDGSTVNQMIVENSLEKSGALLHIAVNGEEGLKLSETIQPDLILLDVIMPDIDGFEVCRRLKANAATQDIPVIFITSLTDTADKVRGFEVGGVDYITTPLQLEEFKTRLASHLRVLKQHRQKEANNSSLMEEIDKRERLEQTLLEQSEFQQSLLNAINDMGLQLWVIEGGRVVYVGNHKTANACGCTEKKLKEHPPLADFIHPDDRERVLAYYRRHLSGEPVPSSYEAALTMPGHGRREYEISLAKIPQSDPVRVVSIGKDITERKKMEMELHQREEAFRAMAENTPDTIARYDLECRRIYSNPSLDNLIEGAWLSGKRSVETNSPSDSSVGYLNALEEAMETGREVEYTLRWQSSGDRLIWSQIRIIPERDAQGRIMSVLAIGRDITELVETEQRQQESQKLLRKLLMHQEANYDARQKWAAWEVYDSLGQLLMVQRMDIGMLQQTAFVDDTAYKEHLVKMQAVTDKAIGIVRSVGSKLRPSAYNMGVPLALEWIVDEFCKKTDINCELNLMEENILLDDTHANMLFHIVQNALDNILSHANATHVSVSLQRENDYYVLKMCDDGMGIDLEVPHEGNLGLFYIQERVHAAGGEVVLFSQDGEGTLLEVRLPVHNILE